MRVEKPVPMDLRRRASQRKSQGAHSVPPPTNFPLWRLEFFAEPLFLDGGVLGQPVREQCPDRCRTVQAIPRVELLDRQRRAQPQDATLTDQAGQAARSIGATAEAED